MNEGIGRILKLLKALGYVCIALGLLGTFSTYEKLGLLLTITGSVCSLPFFLLAWIIDGFTAKARAEREQIRRSLEPGAGIQNR